MMATEPDTLDIPALKALYELRWIINSPGEVWHCGGPGGYIGRFEDPQDAERAVGAINALPALIARVEALEKHNLIFTQDVSDLLALVASYRTSARAVVTAMELPQGYKQALDAVVALRALLDDKEPEPHE